jgi:hypothetical protein
MLLPHLQNASQNRDIKQQTDRLKNVRVQIIGTDNKKSIFHSGGN